MILDSPVRNNEATVNGILMSKASALLIQNVVIVISSAADAERAQKALFALGCGFHNGSALAQNRCVMPRMRGIRVHKNGMLSLFIDRIEQDYTVKDNLLSDDKIVITTEELLSYLSVDDNASKLKVLMRANLAAFDRTDRARDLLYKISRLDAKSINEDQLQLLERIVEEK